MLAVRTTGCKDKFVIIAVVTYTLILLLFQQAAMSGVKRKIEGNDPDYEDVSLVQNNKRNKADEHNGKVDGLNTVCTIP